MEDGHVEVGSQVVHRGFRNLDIGIGIPWQDLLMISPVYLQGGLSYLPIPPPAQQRTMHQPCLYPDILKGRQVGLDKI